MPTLFRRKQTAVVETTEPEPVEETPARTKNYTPSKRELGVATPKRGGTNVRRIGAPPMDKKEATAKRRHDASERRNAMMNDEDWALYDRDRGPERRIARDVVDSRRNIAEYAIYALFAFMLATLFTGRNAAATLDVELVLVLVVVAVIIDSVFLVRKVNRTVAERLPNASTVRLGRYVAMRAMSFRRGRVPKPQVQRGDPIRPVK